MTKRKFNLATLLPTRGAARRNIPFAPTAKFRLGMIYTRVQINEVGEKARLSLFQRIIRHPKHSCKLEVFCYLHHGDARENSADIFAGYGEEGNNDKNEDPTVAKLFEHEVEEDNGDENLKKEERKRY
ncbi:hypothetical protein JTB14_000755 [Gonioctena quinquepunctata]|nr:hypothetical protein JTB14_000755 [Gonioctena quinquepunctata]